MAVPASQIEIGNVINYEGDNWVVLTKDWTQPGKGGGFQQLKLKNINSGTIVQKRFRSAEKLEKAFVENRACEFLYQDGDQLIVMDRETYEQHMLAPEMTESALPYLLPNGEISLMFLDGNPVSAELPSSVVLEIAECEAAVKGNTATNITKEAVAETGLKIKVPMHIKVGDRVTIDTRTGNFLGRKN